MSLCNYCCSLLCVPFVIGYVVLMYSLAVGLLVITAPIWVPVLAFLDWHERRCRRQMVERKEGDPPPRSSLLLAWLKAEKSKVCPLVEWEE